MLQIDLVVNGILARFLELVSPPQYKLASSLIWSAKDEGGFGGGKTTANLAAIRLIVPAILRCI